MAPEIYKRENYTSKVDVWSLGIIAYQLLFRELYFFGKNKWEIEKKVKET
jgi:serine/threonine protein kinase